MTNNELKLCVNTALAGKEEPFLLYYFLLFFESAVFAFVTIIDTTLVCIHRLHLNDYISHTFFGFVFLFLTGVRLPLLNKQIFKKK